MAAARCASVSVGSCSSSGQRSVPHGGVVPGALGQTRHIRGRRFVPAPDVADVGCAHHHRATQRTALQSDKVYQGAFGEWSVEPVDVVEVWSYRVGLTVAALAYVSEGLYGLWPNELSGIREALNPLALVGCLGLGASLQLIHIYVTPLKRALQALWAVGLAGFVYLALSQDAPVAEFVVQNRAYMWLVGPLFAAVTGVAFKEGFCYNKWEAAGLFGAMPLLMGGHLLGMPVEAERGFLASTVVLMAVFAGRKYTQAVKDDIGDKSVFMFQALPEEQQEAILRQRQEERF